MANGPLIFKFTTMALTCSNVTDSLVYRIFRDLKFATDLGVFGGAESKNHIRFCPSRQD